MMTEMEAREIISAFAAVQGDTRFPCPRCGRDSMVVPASRNALSRHASAYVCSECGVDEAMRDWVGKPLPLNEWALLLSLDDGEEA